MWLNTPKLCALLLQNDVPNYSQILYLNIPEWCDSVLPKTYLNTPKLCALILQTDVPKYPQISYLNTPKWRALVLAQFAP
jgi:hypothetical protein